MTRTTLLLCPLTLKRYFSKMSYFSQAINNNTPSKEAEKLLMMKYPKLNAKHIESYQWFVGFTDGDGSFNMSMPKNGNPNIRLNYHVHKDDAQTTEFIKNLFESKSNLSFRKNTPSVSFSIENRDILINKIIPVMELYPTATQKFYSFWLWKNAFLEYLKTRDKKLLEMRGKTINHLQDINIMNLPSMPYDKAINDNYILGFIEAEGSFRIDYSTKEDNQHFKNPRNYKLAILNMSQHEDSIQTLMEIRKFILNNWVNETMLNQIPERVKVKTLERINDSIQMTNKTTKKVQSIEAKSMEFLYYMIIPKLNSLTWHSRKYIDFFMWKTSVEMFIKGLHHTPLGHNLLTEFVKNQNKNRYNTDYKLPYDLINTVLSMKPIYDLNKPYGVNAMNVKDITDNIVDNPQVSNTITETQKLNSININSTTDKMTEDLNINTNKMQETPLSNIKMDSYVVKNQNKVYSNTPVIYYAYNIDDEFNTKLRYKFNSQSETAKFFNISRMSMYRYLHNSTIFTFNSENFVLLNKMLFSEAEFNEYKLLFKNASLNKEKQKLSFEDKRDTYLKTSTTAQKIYVYDLDYNLIDTYLSQKQASLNTKIPRSSLQRYLKSNKPITTFNKLTVIITNYPIITSNNNNISNITPQNINSNIPDNIINMDNNNINDVINNNNIKLPINSDNVIMNNENVKNNTNNSIIKENIKNTNPIMNNMIEPMKIKKSSNAVDIYCYDLNNNLITQFESITLASMFFKVSKSTIMRHVKNKKPLVKDNIHYYLSDSTL
uniref:LADLIDADG maturase/endonuclease-like protein n=1 Tax=Ogataea parapolymorpha (strain ATCC 26012 / BCRC 20466 / JCM 22074 / NRRL Y-7560 / DL-1) TaxID=871575 RepID=E7E828_OGAPD|nr:LADLIDADG maturase/endonuclease-like protein [Ogataea polymorpha]ADT63559.1 LADLIDADG maturase/endonuclease-like protein [Ogataea polymorpha]